MIFLDIHLQVYVSQFFDPTILTVYSCGLVHVLLDNLQMETHCTTFS